ncbi:hypothetical protein KKI24_05165 [bacterium]|nr:hypothetical protein [bacterium]
MSQIIKQPDQQPVKGQDPFIFLKGLSKLQADQRIILCMPKDYCDLYQASLAGRLKNTGITLVITRPDTLPAEFSSYDRILAFQCDLPASGSEKEPIPVNPPGKPPSKTDLFEIKGTPSETRMTPFPRETGNLTVLEERFLQLKKAIQIQEKDEHFQNLASFQQNIRLKLSVIEERQSAIKNLKDQMQTVDSGYFHLLGYFLKQAIDNVLQLFTLGDVMKKYVKILLIDDMGERSYDQLEDKGFRKRFLTTMSQHTFGRTFSEFKQLYQERVPGHEVTHHDFLSKCSVFDEHEVVFYNPWKIDKGMMPVQFRLMKSPELTRKEVRKQNEDPAKLAVRTEKLVKERQKLELLLKTAEYELHTSEAKGGLNETAYVALNKKRKRLLRHIQMISENITEIQKEVDDNPELTFYVKDLLAAFTDPKTIKQIKSQKAVLQPELIKLNPADLHTLSNLLKQKKEIESQVRQLNALVTLMLKKMNAYAGQNPLDPEKTYQQILGIHTLNKLEMTILGCGIAKVNRLVHTSPEEPYFLERWGKQSVNWEDDLLSRVSIFLASKHISVSDMLLQTFFRVKPGDISGRIERSPVLPGIRDFNNDAYDLYILNYDAYPFHELVACLKMRNQSQRPFVPVLILDPMDQIAASRQKTTLDLLIGLEKGAAGMMSLQVAPYRLNSLDDASALYPVLCEVLGINENSVPSLVGEKEDTEPVSDDDWFVEEPFVDPTSEGTIVTAQVQKAVDSDKPMVHPGSRYEDDKIQLIPIKEEPKSIYTLGSLFSFDDDASSIPQESVTADPPRNSGAGMVDEKPIFREKDPAETERNEPSADLSPVKKPVSESPAGKKPNKNPFQF